MMWTDPDPFISLLSDHLARRPGMQPRDVYKLLYQGVRGPEHIIASETSFREWLTQEWEALDSLGEDPLTESIRPDGGLLRLNLRPYKAAHGNLDQLAAACLETARRTWGTQDDLIEVWGHFLESCRAGFWPGLDPREVETLNSLLQDNNFPPIHHSEHYRELYHPAYRLVDAEIELQPPL
jgi:hypothetical protein